MDKRNNKLKNNFTQLLGNVSKLYKEVNTITNESYLQGKKDAYEELLNWFLSSHNGDLRYVSANSFLNTVQEKITKTKTAMSLDDEPNGVNFNTIKIPESRKRLAPNNKFVPSPDETIMMEDSSMGSSPNVVTNNLVSTFPTSVNSMINQAQGDAEQIFPINEEGFGSIRGNVFSTNTQSNLFGVGQTKKKKFK